MISLLLRAGMVGLLITVSSVAGVNPAESDSLTAQNIARAYGAELFGNIAKIRFTFNEQSGRIHIKRSWVWEPRVDRVTFVNPPGHSNVMSYRRKELSTQDTGVLHRIDRLFVNDQYWLLFPLHLAWDKGIKITVDELKTLPIGDGFCRRVTIAYPSSGWYTLGDIYHLFIDEQYHIVQWEYHNCDSASTVTATKWRKHRWAGPLLVSLDRPGRDKNFHIWFTQTAVMLKDIDITTFDTIIDVKGLPLWYPAQ